MRAGSNTPTIWLDQRHPTELRRRWAGLQHVALALALEQAVPSRELHKFQLLDRLLQLQNAVNLPTQRRLGAS